MAKENPKRHTDLHSTLRWWLWRTCRWPISVEKLCRPVCWWMRKV